MSESPVPVSSESSGFNGVSLNEDSLATILADIANGNPEEVFGVSFCILDSVIISLIIASPLNFISRWKFVHWIDVFWKISLSAANRICGN